MRRFIIEPLYFFFKKRKEIETMEKIKVCFEHKIKLSGGANLLCLAGAVLLLTRAKTEWDDHQHYVKLRENIDSRSREYVSGL